MHDSRETIAGNAFVVGHPIKHSRSPLIHNFWLKQFGLPGAYRAVDVAPENFESFLAGVKDGSSDFRGGNVTIPHKEAAYKLADRPDALAEELGAANTLWRQDGLIFATNTDGYGFAANLDERQPGWDGHKKAVIFGAGGAARAVIQAVRDRGFSEVHVVNRTLARARELADRFGPKVHAHPQEALGEVLQDCGLFVNTTSLGMDGEQAVTIDFSPLSSGAVVTDIVYVPLRTPFLQQAEQQGFATVDGLGMLLHQAVPGFEKWFGRRPVVEEAVRSLIIADMAAHA
ncbi:shikimate dehydrogenase [Metarhizobium album]|uniref:Shikimate dehydrogenase (NADP(+)) n=1 Tax=Metarhizobium album TaxID=2182425 RepID=A0A2U2DHF7_9HYPH|nr:shikimate dehydrogenase [Rhizobium album]PWE52730.1 shikimate dehydrogenase [Rhizobium album]